MKATMPKDNAEDAMQCDAMRCSATAALGMQQIRSETAAAAAAAESQQMLHGKCDCQAMTSLGRRGQRRQEVDVHPGCQPCHAPAHSRINNCQPQTIMARMEVATLGKQWHEKSAQKKMAQYTYTCKQILNGGLFKCFYFQGECFF